jgi:hypothetical protein
MMEEETNKGRGGGKRYCKSVCNSCEIMQYDLKGIIFHLNYGAVLSTINLHIKQKSEKLKILAFITKV